MGERVLVGVAHAESACKPFPSSSLSVGLMGEVLKCTGLMLVLVLKPLPGKALLIAEFVCRQKGVRSML